MAFANDSNPAEAKAQNSCASYGTTESRALIRTIFETRSKQFFCLLWSDGNGGLSTDCWVLDSRGSYLRNRNDQWCSRGNTDGLTAKDKEWLAIREHAGSSGNGYPRGAHTWSIGCGRRWKSAACDHVRPSHGDRRLSAHSDPRVGDGRLGLSTVCAHHSCANMYQKPRHVTSPPVPLC